MKKNIGKIITLLICIFLFLTICTTTSSKPPETRNTDIQFHPVIPYNVWVDDDFDSSTPGWQINRFDKIQDGINAVAKNGKVKVNTGTYFENVVVDKSIKLIGTDKHNTIIDGEIKGSVVIVTADNVKIKGFKILNCSNGMPMGSASIKIKSNNNLISDNIIKSDGAGILVDHADYNTITDNTINAYRSQGIFLYYSNYTTIIGNTVLDCDEATMIIKSSFTNVSNNYISTGNTYATGIYLFDSPSNTIYHNIIHDNDDGIAIVGSSTDNIISENTISNNSKSGISTTSSASNNQIFLNNFIDNGEYNAYDVANNNYEYNYWSDYTGEDLNSDGIGDTPYTIPPGLNQDDYPLMQPHQ